MTKREMNEVLEKIYELYELLTEWFCSSSKFRLRLVRFAHITRFARVVSRKDAKGKGAKKGIEKEH